MANFLQNSDIQEQFHIPLSTETFQELQDLQTIIQGLQVQENENETDYWQYVWGFSKYSSKQLYNLTISLDMEIKMQK